MFLFASNVVVFAEGYPFYFTIMLEKLLAS